MEVKNFSIPDLKLIIPQKFEDNRGYFMEIYKKDFFEKNNVPIQWIQENLSCSSPLVLRGLHFQFNQPQAKLVTCLQGKIFDVAVDIRPHSPTYKQHISVMLDSSSPSFFYIPEGFAHGFLALEGSPATVLYKVNAPYNPKGEGSIRWDDPDLKVQWPRQSNLIISPKDQKAPYLKEISEKLESWF
ncbi:MAG: dTDP-4-dehydrorhamnose 3,5-epimerase [Bdellovibrio sp.]|nr:MAG: dTDP-4-dehydrorhamnose 3,5-epimerase [Bdellovibrio sp.]